MIEGKTIAITRSKDDSEEFIELVTQQNATPITPVSYTHLTLPTNREV